MLHRIHDLVGCTITATDGELGRVKDQFFDDESWAIRDCPPYDPAVLPDRSQQESIYRHYGRDGYW